MLTSPTFWGPTQACMEETRVRCEPEVVKTTLLRPSLWPGLRALAPTCPFPQA